MKRVLSTLTILLAFFAGAAAQKIPAYTAEQLMARINSHPDTTYIVNFWATWCGPCVAELPQFDALQERYRGKPVKVLLVSFDFKNDYPQKLEMYVKRKGMKPEVVWFSQTNATEFIPVIEPTWSGGLPATLVAKAKSAYKVFMEKPVKEDEVAKVADAAP